MIEEKKLNSSEYYQPRLESLTATLTISFFLTVLFFINWLISGSGWYLGFCLIALVIFIAFIRPILMKQRVRIENGNITFLNRIGPPLTVPIAESLFEIVSQDNEVKSFRFQTEKRRMQVSPQAYKEGYRLMEQIKTVIKRENVVAQIIEK